MSETMSERVYLLNGEPVVLAEFLDQEFDDDLPEAEGIGETRAQVLEMMPGDVVRLGGGAAPEFELRCVVADPGENLAAAVAVLLGEHEDALRAALIAGGYRGGPTKTAWDAVRLAMVHGGYAELCPHGNVIPLGEDGPCGCRMIAAEPAIVYDSPPCLQVALPAGEHRGSRR